MLAVPLPSSEITAHVVVISLGAVSDVAAVTITTTDINAEGNYYLCNCSEEVIATTDTNCIIMTLILMLFSCACY